MTRYLLAIPALALLGAAPAANSGLNVPHREPARVISPVPSVCGKIGSYAQGESQLPQSKRLGELPPGEAYMAVYRTDAKGCIDPMLASERQGIRAR